jgi:hypothetical protein
MMGKELPETCSAVLKINILLLLHLVGPLLYYFDDAQSNTHQIFMTDVCPSSNLYKTVVNEEKKPQCAKRKLSVNEYYIA